MRTHLIRGVLALVVLVAFSIAPAVAQTVRGKVLDPTGKPVDGATVTFEAEGTNRKASTKTNRNGEFTQNGLEARTWTAIASKDGVGAAVLSAPVTQGSPVDLTFMLSTAPGAGDPKAAAAAAAALQAAASGAIAALQAGRNDEAIKMFNDVLTTVPACAECYSGLGSAHAAKQEYTESEAAYKKALELKPDLSDAYTGLANIYNAQKKFDLAAEASSNAAKYATVGSGGGAEASYNQGVILFNQSKFAEAREQFEAATKVDPSYAPAYYQLGMAALNTGDVPAAVTALETYLKVAPDGPKAAEVNASLPALQAMVK